MAVQFIHDHHSCSGVKSGSSLHAYLHTESLSFCRPPAVAFLRLNPQYKSNFENLCGGKSSAGLSKKNVHARDSAGGRSLAFNANERLKEDSNQQMERIEAFDDVVSKSKSKSTKYQELPMALASSNSPTNSLVDSYYVVEGSKNLNKKLALDSASIESPVENKPSSLIEIPGLPDGNAGSPISSSLWEWKYKWTVHYEKAGSHNVNAPALLFLPGFGVGSFHYESQLRDLGRDFRVWAVDFLGQGRSLPSADPAPRAKGDASGEIVRHWGFGPEVEPWATELVYSVDLWRDQIHNFVEQVIGEPAYIVGNSLGGFVGLYFAACNPQLVKGIALLNATPFWAFVPNPSRSPVVSRLFPWAGKFPLPASARKLMEIGWSKISDPKSIESILKQVYADHSALRDELLLHILETTEHPAAAAAFASIIWAPQGELSFNETLSRCRENSIPICLIYGREDPWVKPIWGQQVKRQVPEAIYYEITPAGHCPHDEVPEVVNFLLRGWVKSIESQGSVALPLYDDPTLLQSDFWKDIEFMKNGSRKSVRTRVVATKPSFWYRMLSFFQSLGTKIGIKPQ